MASSRVNSRSPRIAIRRTASRNVKEFIRKESGMGTPLQLAGATVPRSTATSSRVIRCQGEIGGGFFARFGHFARAAARSASICSRVRRGAVGGGGGVVLFGHGSFSRRRRLCSAVISVRLRSCQPFTSLVLPRTGGQVRSCRFFGISL